MKRTIAGLIAIAVAQGFVFAFGIAQATDFKSHPIPAPVARYLMPDRNEEIALARSAAPAAISRAADVLVLGAHGYETAIKGHNGFTCFVGRSWMLLYDDPDFLKGAFACLPQLRWSALAAPAPI
jgi:hypothetical protein